MNPIGAVQGGKLGLPGGGRLVIRNGKDAQSVVKPGNIIAAEVEIIIRPGIGGGNELGIPRQPCHTPRRRIIYKILGAKLREGRPHRAPWRRNAADLPHRSPLRCGRIVENEVASQINPRGVQLSSGQRRHMVHPHVGNSLPEDGGIDIPGLDHPGAGNPQRVQHLTIHETSERQRGTKTSIPGPATRPKRLMTLRTLGIEVGFETVLQRG